MLARRQRSSESEGPNPYEVLGISTLATLEEVTATYRALAQQYHPDRHVDSPEPVRRQAEQRMREVNQAFLTLKKGAWLAPTPESPIPSTAAPDPQAARAARQRAYRAAREHTAQARAAHATRLQAKQSVPPGQARPISKNSTGGRVVFGLGQAMYTNELTCRGCTSVQQLPPGWQDRLRDTGFSCSVCGRVILSW